MSELPELDDAAEVPGIECDACGTTFQHSGRGRPPKRCPDCRAVRGRSAPSKAEADDSAPRRARAIETLEKNLRTQLAMLGVGIAFLDPFDSRVIITKADQGAKALANLAATNPKIRKLLETSIEGAGYLPVAMWAVSVALPILAHHGFIRGVPDPAGTGRPPASPSGGAPSPNGSLVDMDALQEYLKVS